MHRDYADVSCDGRQHGREELDCTAWPERRSLEIAKLIRGTQNPALREVYFDRGAGDRRRRAPQTPCVGIEVSFFLRISGHRASAIEQVCNRIDGMHADLTNMVFSIRVWNPPPKPEVARPVYDLMKIGQAHFWHDMHTKGTFVSDFAKSRIDEAGITGVHFEHRDQA
jgi:hypothetical protein|nr:hypothetical protein [Erythrobacter donghaensis]